MELVVSPDLACMFNSDFLFLLVFFRERVVICSVSYGDEARLPSSNYWW